LKKIDLFLTSFPWYVILFAVYPALALLEHNIGEIEYDIAWRALIASALISILLVFTLYQIFRDWRKAGALTVLGLLAFFSYGHAFGYVKGLEINGIIIGRHTYFLPVWLGLFFTVGWIIRRAPRQASIFSILSSSLSTTGIVLLVLPSYQLASYQYHTWNNSRQFRPPVIPIPSQSVETYPDIYFIILDMYGRHDVLFEEFDYDDSLFLQKLQGMGFYVASCSQSNYHSTTYSLSATLNANYLTGLSDKFTPDNNDQTLMWQLIQHSAVRDALKKLGYKTVAFETGYSWTEWKDADYFYKLSSNGINDFEDLLLRNSFVSVFFEKGLLDQFRLTANKRKHDLSLYVLDELENVPLLPGPKFVFVHLTIPHPPYVVGPGGELQIVAPRYKNSEAYYVRDEYVIGYQNQLAFLNTRMPQVLRAILDKSTHAPVIILQGDHGPRLIETDKQLDILNAYYFPAPRPELYPSLTPVNNFRIIFNTYFGTSLPILPDRSYFADFTRIYEFRKIPNPCTAGVN